MADAQSLAVGRDNQFIEPAHLLLAMLDAEADGVRPLLIKAGGDVNRLRSLLTAIVDARAWIQGRGWRRCC